jgi:hypothetical protein
MILFRKLLIALGLIGFAPEGTLGASPTAMANSPEAALLALENAYQSRDIEAAVAIKDFVAEAKLMAGELGAADEEIIKSLAETLELSFRADINENGFPNFLGLICSVREKHVRSDGIVALDEVCKDSSGNVISQQIMLASNSQGGWRIVGLDNSQTQ